MIIYLFRRFRRSDRGVALVEFALVAPILFLLVLGIIEFGFLYSGYITLTGAAREGARIAVVGGDEDAIRAAVVNHTVDLQLESGPTVDADISNPGLEGGETIVTVSGELPLRTGFFPFISNTGNNTFAITVDATMRQEIGN